MADHFRLQRVLRYRKQTEDEQLALVLEARNESDAATAQLDALRGQQAHALQQGSGVGRVDVANETRGESYRAALVTAVEIQTDEVVQLETVLEEQETELVQRRQDRRALEKLRDRQAEREALRAHRAETGAIDEIASGRSARRAQKLQQQRANRRERQESDE